ncbi:MAG: site-2 protease family protein [Sphingomonadaceae bacterium]|nr:site-2 protease family protein [Sphingomonadaceae bacterium]
MIETPNAFWAVVFFALAISPLVFIHELGHYLAGRVFGVKADVFSIGFGRAVAGWHDKRGTRWQIGWLPMGGYVRFAGDMNAASAPDPDWLSLPADERNRTFQAKPVWQRALIVLAGPLTNFAFAILAIIAVFAVVGEQRTPPVVGAVARGSAAERAGLRAGDRIAAIDGDSIRRFEDIALFVQTRSGERLTLSVERGGRPLRIEAMPDLEILRDRFGGEEHIGRMGISSGRPILVKLGATELPGAAMRFTASSVGTMADLLKRVSLGQQSIKLLGGPVKMATMSAEVATLKPIAFLFFMAMISINLGFINLLPIPMLDGGHLALYAIEAARRRPVDARAQEWAFRSGLVALLAFMAVVTVNDLAGLGLWNRLAGLIG